MLVFSGVFEDLVEGVCLNGWEWKAWERSVTLRTDFQGPPAVKGSQSRAVRPQGPEDWNEERPVLHKDGVPNSEC